MNLSLEKKNKNKLWILKHISFFFLLCSGLVVHTRTKMAIVMDPFITQIFALKS